MVTEQPPAEITTMDMLRTMPKIEIDSLINFVNDIQDYNELESIVEELKGLYMVVDKYLYIPVY